MAERKMLRHVMSPGDIYAHAETICDMLREHYGSYDADSLDEVMVEETFVERLKARGYDLLAEGAEAEDGATASPPPAPAVPRREPTRPEPGPMPGRRVPTAGSGSVPLRRRDSSGDSDTGVPLRRSPAPSSDSGTPLRRPGQSSGGVPLRRREGSPPTSGSLPLRRRDPLADGDSPPSGDSRPVGRPGYQPMQPSRELPRSDDAGARPTRPAPVPPVPAPVTPSMVAPELTPRTTAPEVTPSTAAPEPVSPAAGTGVEAAPVELSIPQAAEQGPAAPDAAQAAEGTGDQPAAPVVRPVPRTRRTARAKAAGGSQTEQS